MVVDLLVLKKGLEVDTRNICKGKTDRNDV